MQTILIGKLTDVGPVEQKTNHQQQRALVHIQEFDRGTGEKKEPQIFPVMFFNKNIAKCNAFELQGRHVKATCWLRSLQSSKDGRMYYNIALNVTNLEMIE
jgi:hypothetical protein